MLIQPEPRQREEARERQRASQLESERARVRESERAKERESERAKEGVRERERGGAKERESEPHRERERHTSGSLASSALPPPPELGQGEAKKQGLFVRAACLVAILRPHTDFITEGIPP